ncbi:MAG: hypothetical protein M5U27_11940 [Gaiella sp.]|nr:hypothetical protein [Gaiella sp.]
MTDVLIFGDTERHPELRHEIPVSILDPFLYAETNGRRVAVVWSIEGDRIAAVDPTIELVPSETFPSDDLIEAGVDLYDIGPTLTVRQVESLGIVRAVVPARFPLRQADALRGRGSSSSPTSGSSTTADGARHRASSRASGARRVRRRRGCPRSPLFSPAPSRATRAA